MKVQLLGKRVRKNMFALYSGFLAPRDVLEQDAFHKILGIERKRTERSKKSFLLMLVDLGSNLSAPVDLGTAQKIVSIVVKTARETDVVGWYQSSSVLGVIFTELGTEHNPHISLRAMSLRVRAQLGEHLTHEQMNRISISFHLFPEWERNAPQHPTDPTLYPDLVKRRDGLKLFCSVKRVMDIAGSVLLLTVTSPLFALITLSIKLTSKGPVFYRQKRVGCNGVSFLMFKFRSMYENNNTNLHKEYVHQLIAGVAAKHSAATPGDGVYKLTRDPRITQVGAFLRRTSLDELPQLINVIRGEMSLVGPRPPIDYEVEKYELWHRRRLLEAKPGITGLWQVSGRNRVAFDDMVRLDLLYVNAWTPWLDLKILFRTPRAVIEGAH